MYLLWGLLHMYFAKHSENESLSGHVTTSDNSLFIFVSKSNSITKIVGNLSKTQF